MGVEVNGSAVSREGLGEGLVNINDKVGVIKTKVTRNTSNAFNLVILKSDIF